MSKRDVNVSLIEVLGTCPDVRSSGRRGDAPRDERVLREVGKDGGLDDCVVCWYGFWVPAGAGRGDEVVVVVVVSGDPVGMGSDPVGADGDPVLSSACGEVGPGALSSERVVPIPGDAERKTDLRIMQKNKSEVTKGTRGTILIFESCTVM
jgi:hypothetical protein